MAKKIQQLTWPNGDINGWMFYCPGCKENHAYMNDGRWTFNGNLEQPTFQPSLLYTRGHHPDPPDVCHIFMTDGKIQYLSDCTHELAGQTVEVPDWED